MDARFFRVVELVFTAYAVPALIVPFVWLGRRIFRAGRATSSRESEQRLNRALAVYGLSSVLWLACWLALSAGIPIERGGKAAGALLWAAYGLLNFGLASLLVRFTAGYGELPEGISKDRLFLRFLTAVLAQPFATAFAFAVLYRIMGVVYHMKVPGLTAVQEGI